MAVWQRLCEVGAAPAAGEVVEMDSQGVALCVANVEGELRVLDNWCPHRRAPLGQGTLEGEAVVCPWHAWRFSTTSGEALPPDRGHVDVFPVKVEDGLVWVDLG